MKIHITAICGTAMGSLAGLLKQAGHEVRGSDAGIYPPMSDQLAAQGIEIFDGYRAENLDWGPELVVIGNAVTKDNPESVAVRERGMEYTSGAEAIRRFFIRGKHSVVVAGTHGKSTTSSLMAWILESAGRDPGFLVGAVLRNFGTSFKHGQGEHFVVEGDEYDTAYFDKEAKFLHYEPRTTILTSIEFDHADIFADIDAVRREFEKLMAIIPAGGTLIACQDYALVREVSRQCGGQVIPYGLSSGAGWTGKITKADEQGAHLEILRDGKLWGRAVSPLYGEHNLSNQIATAAACEQLGITPEEWRAGIESFKGVKRRQEIRGISPRGVTVVDDFAHHPTAVRLTLEALRTRHPKGTLWAVFEPRTNTTRRAVFQKDYAESFGGADEVIIAGVERPEKAPEGDRFDPGQLAADLSERGTPARCIPDVAKIVEYLKDHAAAGDTIAVLSNGGFGGIHEKLLKAIS